MSDAKVTSKGRITIPKSVRDRLGIRAGDYVRFKVDAEGSVRVEPLDAMGRSRTLAGWLNDRIDAGGPIDIGTLARTMERSVAGRVLSALD